MQNSSGHFNKLDIFQAVDASLREEDSRLRCQFNKAAAYINDLFMIMSNYDVRFHFDPISLDDCRCEVMSPNEVSLLCILKEVPVDSFVLSGEVTSGGVLVEFERHYSTRLDKASWDDVVTEARPGRRFLSPKKLLQTLREVIQRSIYELFQENNREDILYHFTENQISIIVSLGLSGRLRVNLLPAIQMRRCVDPLTKFDRRFRHVLKSLHLTNTTVDSICLVAKPHCADQDLLWRITFNDVEDRIFNTNGFHCARHCLYIMDKLCAKCSPTWGTGDCLLRYHLQAVLLREFLAHPLPKNWDPAKFYSRLKSALASLCGSLLDKKCINIFTGVNLFAHFDADSLKILAKKLSKLKFDARQISDLLQKTQDNSLL